uniref:Uncharacterized protein n=1 Tax=Arundo donax TaxID=35708 RepID=A0A0A9C2R7_ARUDO
MPANARLPNIGSPAPANAALVRVWMSARILACPQPTAGAQFIFGANARANAGERIARQRAGGRGRANDWRWGERDNPNTPLDSRKLFFVMLVLRSSFSALHW